MEKATQLVHGTPSEAASHRTFLLWQVYRARNDLLAVAGEELLEGCEH